MHYDEVQPPYGRLDELLQAQQLELEGTDVHIRNTEIQFIIAAWKDIDPATEVTEGFRADVIARYKEFHNIHNGDIAKHTHNTLTDGQYSRHNLPAIAVIHEWAVEHNDDMMKRSSGMALYSLYSALNYLYEYAETCECGLGEALAEMRAGIVKGDQRYVTFLGLMDYARKYAAKCIRDNIDKVPADVPVVIGKSKPDTFRHRAEHALHEYTESELGVDLGPEFTEKLHDPNIKAVVVSIDVNSTLNVAESYSNLQYLETFSAQMRKLADRFHKKLPDKQLLISLNTGRPALYEWGISDMISSLPEMREVQFAESGGVIVHVEGSGIRPEVAVEKNSLAWQEQLDGMKKHILSHIKQREVTVEPKLSMLSIRIAKRSEDGGDFLLTSKNNEPVTEEWMKSQVHEYLTSTKAQIADNIQEILQHLDSLPGAEKYVSQLSVIAKAGPDGIPGTSDEIPVDALKNLQDVLTDAAKFYTDDLERFREQLTTINLMEQKLHVVFNATAGYVDIFHGDLNKYSAIMKYLKSMGIMPGETLIVHVGDTTPDIIPTTNTGPDEVNDGADEVYLVGMQNSSDSLRDAIRKRGITGKITSRRDILGVIDLTNGITNAIDTPPPADPRTIPVTN